MKQELLNNTDILSVTSSSHIPVFADRGETSWGLHSDENNDLARIIFIGYDFEKTFGINLEEGRFYSTEFASDSIDKIIVNEAAIRKLDLDTAIGKTIYLLEKPYTIIGMTEDFISFPVKIGGEILILPFQEVGNFIFIKTKTEKQSSTLSFIEDIHEKFNPDYPFVYFYMDDYLDPISKAMDMASKIVLYFTFFGIFISCLGLFGLSTFATEQKTKEIAIRKAMGASIRRILLMVNTEFLKLVCIGFLIAIPLSILLVNLMLKGFSRRVELGPGVFIYTGLLILIISFLTIFYQALRSATRNPADNLRYE
jgi:putative ABC transport system permease protein